ncbi:MAG: hypothetical protein K0U54_11100 [Bacteroidetes bacterium]|nr:hypothetical protein [Bacteroidota bacterium]
MLNAAGVYGLDANNETLTLTEGGVSQTYTITRFNENEVRLVFEESEVIDDLPYSFRSEIHLRRQ